MPELPNAGPPKPPPPAGLVATNMPAPPPVTSNTVLKGSDVPPPPVSTLSSAELSKRMVLAFLPDELKSGSAGDDTSIQGVIDSIWETYDVDKSGELDADETKAFVKNTIG